jgi:hypothetical protein
VASQCPKLGRAEVQGHTAAPDPRPHRISSDLAWNPAGARWSLSLKLPVASSAVHRLETAACRSSPWNPCWIWPPPPRVLASDDEDTTLPGSGASCRFWRPRRPPSRSSTGEKEAEWAAARLGSGRIRVVGQLRLARARGTTVDGCWDEVEAGTRFPGMSRSWRASCGVRALNARTRGQERGRHVCRRPRARRTSPEGALSPRARRTSPEGALRPRARWAPLVGASIPRARWAPPEGASAVPPGRAVGAARVVIASCVRFRFVG